MRNLLLTLRLVIINVTSFSVTIGTGCHPKLQECVLEINEQILKDRNSGSKSFLFKTSEK